MVSLIHCMVLKVELLDNMVDYNMEYKVTVHAAATKASLDADVIYQGHVKVFTNYIYNKVWDEITHPFSNFNTFTIEVWEWISNLLPYVITQSTLHT